MENTTEAMYEKMTERVKRLKPTKGNITKISKECAALTDERALKILSSFVFLSPNPDISLEDRLGAYASASAKIPFPVMSRILGLPEILGIDGNTTAMSRLSRLAAFRKSALDAKCDRACAELFLETFEKTKPHVFAIVSSVLDVFLASGDVETAGRFALSILGTQNMGMLLKSLVRSPVRSSSRGEEAAKKYSETVAKLLETFLEKLAPGDEKDAESLSSIFSGWLVGDGAYMAGVRKRVGERAAAKFLDIAENDATLSVMGNVVGSGFLSEDEQNSLAARISRKFPLSADLRGTAARLLYDRKNAEGNWRDVFLSELRRAAMTSGTATESLREMRILVSATGPWRRPEMPVFEAILASARHTLSLDSEGGTVSRDVGEILSDAASWFLRSGVETKSAVDSKIADGLVEIVAEHAPLGALAKLLNSLSEKSDKNGATEKQRLSLAKSVVKKLDAAWGKDALPEDTVFHPTGTLYIGENGVRATRESVSKILESVPMLGKSEEALRVAKSLVRHVLDLRSTTSRMGEALSYSETDGILASVEWLYENGLRGEAVSILAVLMLEHRAVDCPHVYIPAEVFSLAVDVLHWAGSFGARGTLNGKGADTERPGPIRWVKMSETVAYLLENLETDKILAKTTAKLVDVVGTFSFPSSTNTGRRLHEKMLDLFERKLREADGADGARLVASISRMLDTDTDGDFLRETKSPPLARAMERFKETFEKMRSKFGAECEYATEEESGELPFPVKELLPAALFDIRRFSGEENRPILGDAILSSASPDVFPDDGLRVASVLKDRLESGEIFPTSEKVRETMLKFAERDVSLSCASLSVAYLLDGGDGTRDVETVSKLAAIAERAASEVSDRLRGGVVFGGGKAKYAPGGAMGWNLARIAAAFPDVDVPEIKERRRRVFDAVVKTAPDGELVALVADNLDRSDDVMVDSLLKSFSETDAESSVNAQARASAGARVLSTLFSPFDSVSASKLVEHIAKNDRDGEFLAGVVAKLAHRNGTPDTGAVVGACVSALAEKVILRGDGKYEHSDDNVFILKHLWRACEAPFEKKPDLTVALEKILSPETEKRKIEMVRSAVPILALAMDSSLVPLLARVASKTSAHVSGKEFRFQADAETHMLSLVRERLEEFPEEIEDWGAEFIEGWLRWTEGKDIPKGVSMEWERVADTAARAAAKGVEDEDGVDGMPVL